MLQKSKSKPINLVEYALLVPVIFGMLIYSSCENQTDAFDLSQYSYNVKLGEEKMSAEIKEIHHKYEEFLKANKDYVSWAEFDEQTKIASYSIHSINEKMPNTFESEPWEVNSEDGISYKMYVNFKREPETEESRKQKEEELLKLKLEYKNAFEVPFAIIDEVPVFPGCESLTTNDERKNCMSREISMFVSKNFNTNIGKENGLVGRQRINVIFKINQEGNIVDVKSRAPHPALEAEAVRVIKMLPHFEPGINNGKKVIVPYSLPIVFQIQETKTDQEKK